MDMNPMVARGFLTRQRLTWTPVSAASINSEAKKVRVSVQNNGERVLDYVCNNGGYTDFWYPTSAE